MSLEKPVPLMFFPARTFGPLVLSTHDRGGAAQVVAEGPEVAVDIGVAEEPPATADNAERVVEGGTARKAPAV